MENRLQRGRHRARRDHGRGKKLLKRDERRAWHRLAAQMGCTLAECQARVSSREFTGWLAYWQVCPPIEERLDFAAAVIAAAAQSAFGGDFDLQRFTDLLDHAAAFERATETEADRLARLCETVKRTFLNIKPKDV